jgi:hypothetical protein
VCPEELKDVAAERFRFGGLGFLRHKRQCWCGLMLAASSYAVKTKGVFSIT